MIQWPLIDTITAKIVNVLFFYSYAVQFWINLFVAHAVKRLLCDACMHI